MIENAIRTLKSELVHRRKDVAAIEEALSHLQNGARKGPQPVRHRVMSAHGRAAIRKAQRARWAKWRKRKSA